MNCFELLRYQRGGGEEVEELGVKCDKLPPNCWKYVMGTISPRKTNSVR